MGKTSRKAIMLVGATLGFQRNLLPTRETENDIGNKEEVKKKSEQAERGM